MPASNAEFAPGFRLSVLDLFILAAGVGGTFALGAVTWWYGLIVGLVVAHFFLFCNVFRISRPLELLWAMLFLLLVVATVRWEVLGWGMTTSATLILAFIFVLIEMSFPSYHGVGWKRINPQLPEWWDRNANNQNSYI